MNNKNNNLSMMIFDDFRNCKEALKITQSYLTEPGALPNKFTLHSNESCGYTIAATAITLTFSTAFSRSSAGPKASKAQLHSLN